ncbi:sialate O-acetylesterase [Hufsiella ginkgonis]|uniref:Sialate O-acetylesterase n=1 Tax=Hufsiella ginkgonis TaxID=2695274 RepID=A0A7K1XWP0_9SPHI|nr:sialate O-acetylesterase [Hufsiella ginkgonis]MXV15422.1 sialate O-acetylesterase [Hufsiella ginkgonis]
MRTRLLFVVGLLWSCPVSAKVVLPDMISSHMVLQQRSSARLWGKALPGATVRVITSWDDKVYRVRSSVSGDWKVTVNTPKAGGPYAISFNDGVELTLTDILIGDVWVCSGQSNMEMPLAGWGRINDYEREIAEANHPEIRLLHVKHAASEVPLTEAAVTANGWQACSPQTIPEFSAVAYFFARAINRQTHVPIGLVNSTWGATAAEAWTSAAGLQALPPFKPQSADNRNQLSALFNAMIHPFLPWKIKGVAWYQGESNVDRAQQYYQLFPALIADWRRQWQAPRLPFYFVQLAAFTDRKAEPGESNWAEIRDAQLKALALPNTGMAVTIDIGDAKDIHPKNKQEVGRRLALIALAKLYGSPAGYSGPIYRAHKTRKNEITVSFRFAEGLKASGGVQGFEIAGADKKFYKATAIIKGSKVIVSSSGVANPVAVGYSWATNPDGNLYNSDDLPASPFRTDFKQ